VRRKVGSNIIYGTASERLNAISFGPPNPGGELGNKNPQNPDLRSRTTGITAQSTRDPTQQELDRAGAIVYKRGELDTKNARPSGELETSNEILGKQSLDELLDSMPLQDLRENRMELMNLRTKLEINKTKEALEKRQNKPLEGLQIENLANVLTLIELEVRKTNRYESLQFLIARLGAQEYLKGILVKDKKKYVGTLVVELKPGYEQMTQRHLTEMQPSNPFVDICGVALWLKGIGYLTVRKE